MLNVCLSDFWTWIFQYEKCLLRVGRGPPSKKVHQAMDSQILFFVLVNFFQGHPKPGEKQQVEGAYL